VSAPGEFTPFVETRAAVTTHCEVDRERIASRPSGVTVMNRFTYLATSLLRCARSVAHPAREKRPVKRAGLCPEPLGDRCLPSGSPLTLAANHNLMDGSTVVLGNVEQYLWSSATNTVFALQQGGTLRDYTSAAPTRVHAVIGSNVESIGLAADGTLYDLLLGGQLQESTNSGSSWTVRDAQAESLGVTSAGRVFDLDAGGQLRVSSDRGGTWTALDANTQSFAVTAGGTLYNLIGGGTLESSTNAGSTWTTTDTRTVSFAVTTSGTVYDLDPGGQLRELPTGGSWKTVDGDTQAYAVTPGGTLYDLHAGGTLRVSTDAGTSWTTLDGNAQTFAVAVNGALYVLDAGGRLRWVPTSGSSWGTLDTATRQFALSANGTLYDLDEGGLLQSLSLPGGSWTWLDNISQSFGLDRAGTLYDLDSGGTFWYLTPSGYWPRLDNDTTWFAVQPDGTVYDLDASGLLQSAAGPGAAWTSLDNIAQSIAVSPNGTLYDLNPNGQLWMIAPGGSWQWLDGGTGSFSLMPNGTLVDLDLGNALWVLPDDGGWQWLDGNTRAYAVGPNGSIFNLLAGGQFERSSDAGATWAVFDTATAGFGVTPDGTIENLPAGGLPEASLDSGNSWTDLFAVVAPDVGVADLGRNDYLRDGGLTRSDVLGLFAEAEADGTVTQAELTSLQALVSTCAVAMPDAVRNLAGKVVNGNPADDWFQGQWLGDLWPGAPSSQLDTLVRKWFYGADHPQTDTDPTTGNPYAYAPAGGTLFGASGVPSYNDIAQSYADCYLMASLGQVALQAPAAIQGMFTNNGDGTMTVRFFNNGVADYVTVDMDLPVAADGEFVYAGYDRYGQPTRVAGGSNVLWPALAEKAYAQLAEEGWSRADHGSFANSYDSIYFGWATTAMSQITGSTVTSLVIPSGPNATPNTESVVLSDLAQNHLVCLGTLDTFPDSNTAFIGDHVYMLESYDPTTGVFTFINPLDDGVGARVVRVTWDQLAPYVGAFEDLTAPAGVSVNSVVGNPPP
jgi:hypothetical protein